jgi:hypothetical protein
MRLLLGLLSAACLISFYACTACSKKIDCPGFNDTELTQWFPYVDNQQLIFQSNTNERDTFTLQNVETTESYQSTTGYNRSPVCQAFKRFQSYEKNQNKVSRLNLQLIVMSDTYDSIIVRNADFSLDSIDINMTNLRDTGFQSITTYLGTMTQKHFPTFQIGGQSFMKVTAAYRDTVQDKRSGIYEIYFALNNGLIAYKTYPSLVTWVKH